MVVSPAFVGVKVPVYTVLLVAVKSEMVPPVTLISPTAKSLVFAGGKGNSQTTVACDRRIGNGGTTTIGSGNGQSWASVVKVR